MVSLYFNVFSSLSLSNLLPRVQLASLLNNQNSNSFLNRFGIQDTVTDLLNRVGFDQTFSIGNKIGIDRPDSVLNKLELGMNNVINLSQQGLLNPGPSGGLYGGNGPGQYPGGGVSGTGAYGGQAGISGVPGPLGGQGSWQGQTQGSFPIGGNRPGPGGYPQGGGQFGGGPQDDGGGSNEGFGYGGEGQSGNSGSGGMLSGLLSQMGNRFGWGSSSNKNEPKDYYYKQAGNLPTSEHWINDEDSHEYWLEESLQDVLEPGRTTDAPDAVLKYLVESQIKKLIATLLQHLAEAKVKPEEQVKMNEAAETELRKLTPDQIKRIAHDIVEREKSKVSRLNAYKGASRKPAAVLSEDDLKRLLVESTKRKDILPDRAEIVRLLETAQLFREKERNRAGPEVNKTTMSQVIQQLNSKPNMARLVHKVAGDKVADDEKTTANLTTLSSEENDESDSDRKYLLDKRKDVTTQKHETAKEGNSNKTSPIDNEDTYHPKLYISEQMRNNINELLEQLTSGSRRNDSKEDKKTSAVATKDSEYYAFTPLVTTTKSTTTPKVEVVSTTSTDMTQTPNTANDTSKLVNNSADDDGVRLLLQRLFGNANDETLTPLLQQKGPSNSPAMKNVENTLKSTGQERSFRKLTNPERSFRKSTGRDLNFSNWVEKRLSPETRFVPNGRTIEDGKLLASSGPGGVLRESVGGDATIKQTHGKQTTTVHTLTSDSSEYPERKISERTDTGKEITTSSSLVSEHPPVSNLSESKFAADFKPFTESERKFATVSKSSTERSVPAKDNRADLTKPRKRGGQFLEPPVASRWFRRRSHKKAEKSAVKF